MTRIYAGITAADFITIMNANCTGYGGTLSSSSNLVTVLNTNFSLINAVYPITLNSLSVGMVGSSLLSLINANTDAFDASRFTTNVENDATSPTVLTTTEKSAILSLVAELKDDGIWEKFKIIYPFVTDTYDACKYNLVGTANTDAAFRMSEVVAGTKEYNAGFSCRQGLQLTQLTLGSDLTKDNYHVSFWNDWDIQGTGFCWGAAHSGGTAYMRFDDSTFRIISDSNNDFSVSNSSEIGDFLANVSSSRVRLFNNGVRVSDNAQIAAGVVPDVKLGIFGGYNGTGAVGGSTYWRGTFFTMGTGLSDAEVALLYTAKNNFLTRIRRYRTANNSLITLTDAGTHTPATSSNSYLAKYKAFKLGGLISYSIYTYQYGAPYPASPNLFYKGTHDIDTMVSNAKNAGIQYLVLSVCDNSMFSLFDNPIPFPDYVLNQVVGHRKYDVASAGADTGITDKFFTACAKYGIEPIPYMCFVAAMNLARTYTYISYTDLQWQYVENWYAAVVQYILKTWNPNYFWYDVSANVNHHQMFYDAAKAINSNCQIISNNIGDIALAYYPYDIGSNEEFFSLHDGQTWPQVLATSRTKSGTTYYVPQELITNIFAGGAGVSYYWSPSQTLRTQQAIQSIYNTAKTNGAPFLLNLGPNRSGVIPSEQFALFSGLTL